MPKSTPYFYEKDCKLALVCHCGSYRWRQADYFYDENGRRALVCLQCDLCGASSFTESEIGKLAIDYFRIRKTIEKLKKQRSEKVGGTKCQGSSEYGTCYERWKKGDRGEDTCERCRLLIEFAEKINPRANIARSLRIRINFLIKKLRTM